MPQLPSAMESERTVLLSILYDNELIYQAGDLKAQDFYIAPHRHIFRALWNVISAGDVADLVSVADRLEKDNEHGAAEHLQVFDDGVMPVRNIETHVKTILSTSQRRQIINCLQAGVNQAFDNSESNEDVVSVTHERLLQIATSSQSHPSLQLKDFSAAVYFNINKIANREKHMTIGLKTGIAELDDMTTGLRPGEYYVIGSWTGEGKTALALQMMAANCLDAVPILFFSQEMSKEQVMLRLVPALVGGRVTARMLRDPREMNISQLSDFQRTQEIVDSWPLWVNDASTFEVSQLVAHSYMMIHRHAIRLIVVDYLQLLKAPGEKRYEQVSAASSALRELAKSQGIPVVAISQLSKPSDKTSKRAPTMFDMKESGQIEQDAHAIFMPYRPLAKDTKTMAHSGEDVIIVGKQREGPTGGVRVRFDSRLLTFQPRTREPEQGYANDKLDEGW